MAIAPQEAIFGTLTRRIPETNFDLLRDWAHTRLTTVFEAAQQIPFDDSSKIILFSDCHRGDNSRADRFARNEALFLHALDFYHRGGFTYIEVGDGDDVWKTRSHKDIVRAHPRTFGMLHRFHRQDRLHLIYGNHDSPNHQPGKLKKDGLVAVESLVLQHANTGQRVFLVHGHQADFKSDRLCVLSRMTVRYGWRRLQLLGIESALRHTKAILEVINRRAASGGGNGTQRFWISNIGQAKKLCAKRIMSWAAANRQLVIYAHTHRPTAPACGAPPCFNTGCCDVPGRLTGLEIQNGAIALVQWTSQAGGQNGMTSRIKRELMAPPRKLCRLA
jgi:UDP-2,3-diacylglucosamine pyrophosphatase LpxH